MRLFYLLFRGLAIVFLPSVSRAVAKSIARHGENSNAASSSRQMTPLVATALYTVLGFADILFLRSKNTTGKWQGLAQNLSPRNDHWSAGLFNRRTSRWAWLDVILLFAAAWSAYRKFRQQSEEPASR